MTMEKRISSSKERVQRMDAELKKLLEELRALREAVTKNLKENE